MKPEKLSNKEINQIGKAYNQAHGGFFSKIGHKNHALAKELNDYNIVSTSKQKWEFLLSIYKKLNGSVGDLSVLIENQFLNAFNITTTVLIHDSLGQAHLVQRAPKEIINDMQSYIDKQFDGAWSDVELKSAAPVVGRGWSTNS